jgi:hypothetical protein
MTRQSIPRAIKPCPRAIKPCPPPCENGKIVIDDDMPPGLMFDVEQHEACGGSGLEDQIKYAPLDRIRRVIGHQLGHLRIDGRTLDQLAGAIGEEVVRIVRGSVESLGDQSIGNGDPALTNLVLVAMSSAVSPFRRPLAYSSCTACGTAGCDACEERGFVPTQDYARMGERPLI